ncbi:MAG: protein translocase subunit SecD [Nitriliruptoraceae bacterium]
METRPLYASLAAVLLVAVLAGVYLGTGARPSLGLDLQGGISAVYTPVLPPGEETPEDLEAIIDETIEVIRARVDSLGVAEPDISRTGTDVQVQLPGIADADRVQEIIGTTAQLSFRRVEGEILPGTDEYETEGPDCLGPVDTRTLLPNDEAGILCGSPDEGITDPDSGESLPIKYRVGPAELTGENVEDAFVQVGSGTQAFQVGLNLDDAGAEVFAAVTSDLACERDAGQDGRFAIVLDGTVESTPGVNPTVACGVGITGGSASITTGAGLTREEQEQEASDLALVLRTGALPISLEPSTFQTVSPTLGAESLQAGLLAGLIGLLFVGVWLVVFYRWIGLIAMGVVALYGLFVVAGVSAMGELIGFTLTLAGVAGIIVSIGITADSSIIFAERIRDEVNLGKTVRTAVVRAFDSAWRTNLTGNTVTLAAAVILYFLAVGPVRGFALMLGISSVLDLILMYTVARPSVFLLAASGKLSRRSLRAVDPEARPRAGARA